jgi:hypothetical protein
MTAPEHQEDPVATLSRWEESGAVWRVVARTGDTVTVALYQCDGGQEVHRVSSPDLRLRAFLAGRSSSDQ